MMKEAIERTKVKNIGMTLMELLVVISTVGILVGSTVVVVGVAKERARKSRAKSELRLYGIAVRQYNNEHNLDYNLITRWPLDVRPGGKSPATGGNCSDDLTPVPNELWVDGLIKDRGCREFDYENWPKPSGLNAAQDNYQGNHVIGITWYGLNGVRFDNGAGDNILLVIQGENNLTGLTESDYSRSIPDEVTTLSAN